MAVSLGSLPSLPPDVVRQLLAGPAGFPPPGQESKLGISPQFFTSGIVAVIIIQGMLAIIVPIRLFTQHYLSNGLATEDYIMIAGCLFSIGSVTAGFWSYFYGTGTHMWDITVESLIEMLKRAYFFSIFFVAAIACIKTAIVLQFIRILAPYRVNKPACIACWVCIGINLVFYITYGLLLIFQCSPINKMWDLFQAGHCISLGNIYKAGVVFSVVSDFAILFIPIPIIWKLQMPVKRRLAALAVFATGITVCIASTVRVYYTWLLFGQEDQSYYLWFVGLWCSIEMFLGFVIYCAPTMPQFYHYMRNKWQPPSASLASGTLSYHVENATPGKRPKDPYELPSLVSIEQHTAVPKLMSTTLTAMSETDVSGKDLHAPS